MNGENILTHKRFANLLNWRIDKYVINKWIVSKIEIYNYFSYIDAQKIIKIFQRKDYKWTNDTSKFHPIFNVIRAHEWCYIANNKVIPPWIILPKYYYHVLFARVLVHRGSHFLVKIYHNKSQAKNFVKMEITYARYKNLYNLSYWDWASRIKWISEVINNLQRFITPIGFSEDFSGGNDILRICNDFMASYDTLKRKKIISLLS